MSHHDGKLGGKVIINGFIKPFSDNEQLSEVGNGENQPHSGQPFRHFGRPKKGSLASRGVPNFGHILFMAALAYPFRDVFDVGRRPVKIQSSSSRNAIKLPFSRFFRCAVPFFSLFPASPPMAKSTVWVVLTGKPFGKCAEL